MVVRCEVRHTQSVSQTQDPSIALEASGAVETARFVDESLFRNGPGGFTAKWGGVAVGLLD